MLTTIKTMEIKLEPKKGDNDLWGFVDEEGKWVIKPRFYDAGPFEYGIAVV